MWSIDAVFEYAELRAEYFTPNLEDMLNDAKTLQKILDGADQNFIQRFATKIKEFFKAMEKFLSDLMDGYHSYAEAAQLLRQSMKAVKDAENLWIKTFEAAIATNQARNEQLAKVGLQTDDNGYVYEDLLSEKTFRQSEYSTDIKKAAAELAKSMGITDEEAEQYIKDVGSIANKIARNREKLCFNRR